jgi:DNA primase
MPTIGCPEIYGFLFSVLEFTAVPGVDFQAVRSQVSISQVLELLGFRAGRLLGDQVRGACPIHGSTSRHSRSFSANLRKNTYQCFKCGSAGNQLDLWAEATKQNIYQAAVDLCGKLHLEIPLIHRRS